MNIYSSAVNILSYHKSSSIIYVKNIIGRREVGGGGGG